MDKRCYSSDERLSIYRESLHSGRTIKEIADKYGISERLLNDWRREYSNFAKYFKEDIASSVTTVKAHRFRN
jgi:transposase-like protein